MRSGAARYTMNVDFTETEGYMIRLFEAQNLIKRMMNPIMSKKMNGVLKIKNFFLKIKL